VIRVEFNEKMVFEESAKVRKSLWLSKGRVLGGSNRKSKSSALRDA
jgi:hypothetical protein